MGKKGITRDKYSQRGEDGSPYLAQVLVDTTYIKPEGSTAKLFSPKLVAGNMDGGNCHGESTTQPRIGDGGEVGEYAILVMDGTGGG